MRRFFASAALLALAVAPGACAQARNETGWALTPVVQTPASPSPEGVGARFGSLTFQGGVALASSDPNFGGWSSIKIDRDGRLLGISDKGAWISAAIVTDAKSGAFTGLSDVKTALMRDLNGDPLATKQAGDAESLAPLPDGRFAVGFEQDHRIWIYDLAKNGPVGKAAPGPALGAALDKLKPNEGLEALVATAQGDLIGGAEETPSSGGPNAFRFKIGAQTDKVLLGHAQITKGYSFVDLERLADGDFIALERSYFPVIGTKIGIRRFAGAGAGAEKLELAGELLAQFAPPHLLDNFEGIAALVLPSGATRLYLMSDDNFSDTQKTLIYAFDLAGPAKPEAGSDKGATNK